MRMGGDDEEEEDEAHNAAAAPAAEAVMANCGGLLTCAARCALLGASAGLRMPVGVVEPLRLRLGLTWPEAEGEPRALPGPP
jgi:hypothetical protein